MANPFAEDEYPDRPARGPGHPLRLVFVGRVVESKGILDAIKAVPLLACPVTLTVAGDGPLLSKARHLACTLDLDDRVLFVGRLEGAALHSLYLESDVLVLPTFWAEGFPTVLAEAMAAGLGIVTTPVRGARDYLTDGENCLFVPPRSPGQIAAAVQRLHDERRLLREMGTSNRKVVSRFAPDRVVDEYEKALLHVIADSGRAEV